MANIKNELVESLNIDELIKKVKLFCLVTATDWKDNKDGTITIKSTNLTLKDSNNLCAKINEFFTSTHVKVSFCEDIDPIKFMEDDSYKLKVTLTLA